MHQKNHVTSPYVTEVPSDQYHHINVVLLILSNSWDGNAALSLNCFCDITIVHRFQLRQKQLMASSAVLFIKHTSTYLFFWQFKVITWVIKFNYFHNLNLWFCCFDHSHAEQSCASHVTVSLFFTRLVLVSGLHLWESYVGLMPSIALLPAHSCSPSTIHSPCPPHRLLFTSLFCYYNTWSAHTHTT